MEALVMAGLLADGKVESNGADDIHVVLLPTIHLAQLISLNGGLDLGIDLLSTADAGGIDGRIAQSLQHHSGIFKDLHLLIKIGEGIDEKSFRG